MDNRRVHKRSAASAVSFRQIQDDDEMIGVWTEQIRRHSAAKSDKAQRSLCNAYCNRGAIYRAQEKHDLAIADFTAALMKMPQHQEALQQLGKYPHFEGGDLDEVRDFKRVQIAYHFRSSDLYPSSYQSELTLSKLHLNLGLVLQQQGDHHEAIAAFDDAESARPQYASVTDLNLQKIRLARAKSLLNQGLMKVSALQLHVEQLVDEQPDFVLLYAYLASLANLNDVAEKLLNHVIIKAPSQPWAYVQRGQLFEKTNRQDLAVADYQRGWLIGKAMSGGSIYCLLQLHRLNQLPQEIILINVVNDFAVVRQHCADDLCVMMLLLVAANEFELVKELMLRLLKEFLPQAVPHHLQADFLKLLINPDYWPEQDITILNGWWGECKDQLVEMFIHQQNREVGLNAALHALSQYSQIGCVMHHKRIGTTPSIAAGRLQKIAHYLNERTNEIANLQLYPATRQVLANEAKLNPDFVETLQKSYPALFAVLRPVLNLQPQIVSRSGGYAFMQNLFGRVDKDKPDIQDEAGNRFVLEL